MSFLFENHTQTGVSILQKTLTKAVLKQLADYFLSNGLSIYQRLLYPCGLLFQTFSKGKNAKYSLVPVSQKSHDCELRYFWTVNHIWL